MTRPRSGGVFVVAAAVLALCWASQSTSALVEVSRGNDPVENRGWPLGCEKVANLPDRIGHWVGPWGAEYHFVYRCTGTAEFNEALQTFSEIRVPRHVRDSVVSDSGEVIYRAEPRPLVLVVQDGPGTNWVFGPEAPFDWTFTVQTPAVWHQLHNDPRTILFSDSPGFRQPAPRPQIDAYVGAGGSIVWEEVKVPDNVRVIDRRAQSAPVSTAGGMVRGEVYDMATGQPIAGAEVVSAVVRKAPTDWEGVAIARTDEVGSAQLDGLGVGDYEIRVRAEGYAPRTQGRYRNRGSTCYEFVAELSRAASVKGVVRDTNGAPIPGVEVRAECTRGIDGLGYPSPAGGRATTDGQGRFEVGLLPEGWTGIRCRAPSLYQKTSILEVYKVPSDDIQIVMTGTGIVRGKVVRQDGTALQGEVHVNIQPPGPQRIGMWGGSMKCNDAGSFEFAGVPPGTYLVSTAFPSVIEEDAAKALSVTVEAGQTVELQVPDQTR